ncbi:hypothetical protein [Flaviaesturariibacter amylovorans]|uniref:PorT family protein n=1 Tax=Flaviaesturariibacter amylovorans TaxID=1084520 RepID=A0ABP8H8F7_9BACT
MRILLLAVLLVAAHGLFAQKSVSRATFLTYDRQKLEGFVRNTAYEGTPQAFEFGWSENGPFNVIPLSQVKEVRMADGRIYEQHPVSLSVIAAPYISRVRNEYVNPANQLSGNVFLEKILDAPVGLYQYVDRYLFPHFFYMSAPDTSVVYLDYRPFDDNGNLRENAGYKDKLKRLAEDKSCRSAGRLVPNLDYARATMLRMFQRLNACGGGAAAPARKTGQQRMRVSFGLMGGISMISSRKIEEDFTGFPALHEKAFGASSKPAFGAYVSFYPAKTVRNYVFSIEVLHQSYATASDSVTQGNYTGKGTLSQGMLSLAPVMRLLLTQGKVLNPFLEAGGSAHYTYRSDLRYHYRHHLFPGSAMYTRSTATNGFSFGALLGAGLDLKRVSLHARYGISGSDYTSFLLLAKVNLF